MPGLSTKLESRPIAPTTPVITIQGFCRPKPAVKLPPGSCKTQITRAEFEKLTDLVQPDMPPALKRQFAEHYANSLVLSDKAHLMGLDQTAAFQQLMKLVRLDVLSQQLVKSMQQRASQVSEMEIQDYYRANTAAFEQANVERIFIPKTRQAGPSDAGLSPEDMKRRQESGEADMKQEADRVRARAAAGEDFSKLQTEAFQFASLTNPPPGTTLSVRRNTIPQSHGVVFDLASGTVSDVIADPTSGYYIYKMVKKDTLPLDKVHDEVRSAVQSQKTKQTTDALKSAATTVLDADYFKVPENSQPGRTHPRIVPRPGSPLPGQPMPGMPVSK
jgi:PPIC-type PPIASE domain